MLLVGHLLPMNTAAAARVVNTRFATFAHNDVTGGCMLHAGVVGFLAVCCLAGVLLWKHRHWWSNGNGGAKDLDTDEPDKDP